MPFELSNHTSINLNFLIYINNLYQNITSTHELPKFPWLPMEKEGLLEPDAFQSKANTLWDTIYKSDEFIGMDFKSWKEEKFPFETLFMENESGRKNFAAVKKSFLAWWFQVGSRSLDVHGSELIPSYYHKVKELSESQQAILKSARFYIEVLYDTPPPDWTTEHRFCILTSPNIRDPELESLYQIVIEQ